MENLQRPLIDRPRYVSNSQNNVNTRSNKVVNKEVPIQENQTQQPISGSANNLKPPTKRKIKKPPFVGSPRHKRKTKKTPGAPRQLKTSKKNKGGMLKQMKDKFIGKPKGKGGN